MMNHDATTNQPSTPFSPAVATQVRHAMVALRFFNILQAEAPTHIRWEPATMQALHNACFAPVFPWAGVWRTAELNSPAGIPYATLLGDRMHNVLIGAFELIRTTRWGSLTHQAFAEQLADVYARIHFAQPFAHGTGQVARILLHTLTQRSPFTLRYTRIPADAWNRALASVMPASPEGAPDPEPLVPLFARAAVPVNPAMAHGYTSELPATHTEIDVASMYHDLFINMSPTFQGTINEVFANNWLSGWNPNRADVANLMLVYRKKMDVKTYLEEATIEL